MPSGTTGRFTSSKGKQKSPKAAPSGASPRWPVRVSARAAVVADGNERLDPCKDGSGRVVHGLCGSRTPVSWLPARPSRRVHELAPLSWHGWRAVAKGVCLRHTHACPPVWTPSRRLSTPCDVGLDACAHSESFGGTALAAPSPYYGIRWHSSLSPVPRSSLGACRWLHPQGCVPHARPRRSGSTVAPPRSTGNEMCR